MDRRKFLQNTGLALGASAIPLKGESKGAAVPASLDTWADVRAQFSLNPGRIHMSQMLLASHPLPVRMEIEKHRKNFDENPVEYWENNWRTAEGIVQKGLGLTLADLAQTAPLLDLWQGAQDRLYSRLFQS